MHNNEQWSSGHRQDEYTSLRQSPHHSMHMQKKCKQNEINEKNSKKNSKSTSKRTISLGLKKISQGGFFSSKSTKK